MRSVCMAVVALLMAASLGVAATMADVAPEKPKAEEPKEDSKKDEDEIIDMPWTAEKVQKSIKKGTEFTYMTLTHPGGKETKDYAVIEVIETTDENCKIKRSRADFEGKVLGEGTESEVKWADFMNPKLKKSKVTVTEESITVGAGKFECKVYKRDDSRNNVPAHSTFWFAKDQPGVLVKSYSFNGMAAVIVTLEKCKMGK